MNIGQKGFSLNKKWGERYWATLVTFCVEISRKRVNVTVYQRSEYISKKANLHHYCSLLCCSQAIDVDMFLSRRLTAFNFLCEPWTLFMENRNHVVICFCVPDHINLKYEISEICYRHPVDFVYYHVKSLRLEAIFL